jgi:hypothetical protein
LTLILPAADRVNYSRATRKRVTSDGAAVLSRATVPDLMAALDDWAGRNGQLLATRAKAAARKAETEAEARRRGEALRARWAEREAEEAAAAAREVA